MPLCELSSTDGFAHGSMADCAERSIVDLGPEQLWTIESHICVQMAVLGDPASIAMVDIKQKDGFIIVQPDG